MSDVRTQIIGECLCNGRGRAQTGTVRLGRALLRQLGGLNGINGVQQRQQQQRRSWLPHTVPHYSARHIAPRQPLLPTSTCCCPRHLHVVFSEPGSPPHATSGVGEARSRVISAPRGKEAPRVSRREIQSTRNDPSASTPRSPTGELRTSHSSSGLSATAG
jgi:hypothetical protein